MILAPLPLRVNPRTGCSLVYNSLPSTDFNDLLREKQPWNRVMRVSTAHRDDSVVVT
jgi:hypothetical protein